MDKNKHNQLQKSIVLAGLIRVGRIVRDIVRYPLKVRRALAEWQKAKYRKYTTKMHKILYKCPHCHAEMQMNSYRKILWCEVCGSHWMFWKSRRVLPLGTKISFRTRDEWKTWERDCVREEVASGKYHFTDTVRVKMQNASGEQIDWGYGTLTHTSQYVLLECRYKNEDYTLIRSGRRMEQLPFELGKEGGPDYVELSSGTETFLCYLSRKDAAVKMALAVEEIYKLAHQK